MNEDQLRQEIEKIVGLEGTMRRIGEAQKAPYKGNVNAMMLDDFTDLAVRFARDSEIKVCKTWFRFWSSVNKQAENGCWIWTGSLDINGYGQFSQNYKNHKAHRIAYEYLCKKVPDGLQLDHLCRVRNCINPDHLEPVTGKENVLRGEGVTAKNAKATHCPAGHEYAVHGYKTKVGSRNCKPCRWKQARERKRLQLKESHGCNCDVFVATGEHNPTCAVVGKDHRHRLATLGEPEKTCTCPKEDFYGESSKIGTDDNCPLHGDSPQ